jgi:hypothetical protein
MKPVTPRLGVAAVIVTASIASSAAFSQSAHDNGTGEAGPTTAQSTPDHADRTLAAIHRMLPAHAREIDGRSGWSAKTASLPNGELLTVTSNDPKEVARIRGLGFIGLLVSGAHHQPHHVRARHGPQWRAIGPIASAHQVSETAIRSIAAPS